MPAGSDAVAAPRPIVLLIAGSSLGRCVADALAQRLSPLVVIEEQPESKRAIIRRRARLLGWWTALGQAACGLMLRALDRRSARRRAAICRDAGLDRRPAEAPVVHRVASVNTEECRALLQQLAPAVVAVYGTRIIGKKTLAAVDVPFINYHAGINPKYRGQHPAYWALANRDAAHAGVTVHLVDDGVDTGAVLYQAPVTFTREDSILTYQWAQLPVALPLFERALRDALAGRLQPQRIDLPSALYYPPTIWTYLWNGLAKGVW
jgi:folate-dependent phosphoribosylglycinamide formyltransferase PurN